MNIQVIGSGCTTCKKLHELVLKAASEVNKKAKVEYITGSEGMQKIIELGVMTTPILTVNGKVAMTGATSDIDKIKKLIKET